MKIHKMTVLIVFASVLGTPVWVFDNLAQGNRGEPKIPLTIKVSSSKGQYVTGEPVVLETRVQNVGKRRVPMPAPFTMKSGNLQVLVAKKNLEFGRYLGPKWGIDEFSLNLSIKPGGIVSNSARIFWNAAPRVGHLNSDAAKSVLKGRVTTDYAFDEPGEYRIKILSVLGKQRIESNEITIAVTEPTGDDLGIWNAIKDRPELGYFIQTGEPKAYRPAGQQKAKKELESLLSRFPNGLISVAVQNSLEAFANRNKRNR